MTINTAMPLAASAVGAALLILLVSQRTYRTLPAFFSYQAWCLCSGVAGFVVLRFFQHDYVRFYLLNISGDALFQLAVLLELGRVVLRHNRVAAPRRTVLLLLLMTAILMIWSLAKWTLPEHLPQPFLLALRMRQLFSVLQFASLLALVWLSTLRGLRWPERALQVGSGLGFYFLIDLAVMILHTHQSFGHQYVSLDYVASFSYLGVLAYWVFCFAHNERDRREATP